MCIDRMKLKYPNHQWAVLDATDMRSMFANDNSVDVVLDKGVLDAMLVNDKFFKKELDPDADKMVCEVFRVLKPHGGKFIVISFEWWVRKYFENRFNWTMETLTIGEGFHYYVYILTKN